MTFNKLPVDHRSVTRRESWNDTQILFDSTHVGLYMIYDGEAIGLKMLNPLLTASAVSISVHIDGQTPVLLERLNR